MPETRSAPPATVHDWTAWDRFLETTPETGFMQSSWWADFRTATGWEHFGAVLKSRGVVVGGAVVMRFAYRDDRCFYYIPEGPVLPDDEALAAEIWAVVEEAVEERRRADDLTVSHFRIEPRWQRRPGFLQGFQPTRTFHEPRATRCVDLRPSEAAILAGMRPKGRYHVGLAQRRGVAVVEDTSDRGVADFLDIYRETMARQRLRGKPPDYFRMLIPLLTSHGRGSLFFSEWQGQRLATALVVYFGRRATYFFAGSRATHRDVQAPSLLQFEIMRRARALGHEWYDFWGAAPESEPDHPWANITVFKREFGGLHLDLVPTLDRVYDPAAYEDYVTNHA